jgi:hypothetical protein
MNTKEQVYIGICLIEMSNMAAEELKSWMDVHKDELFANDAVGTGCFSYLPGEVVWAVTKRCNLRCKHCSKMPPN